MRTLTSDRRGGVCRIAAMLWVASCTAMPGMVFTPTTAPNMNGAYVLANGDAFPTDFRAYPGGVESFDAYHGPINSTYGEVWWTTATDDLPADVVARFAGRTMAIVGIEMDQVRRGAGPGGEDVSVPINCAYNHHHNTAIVGAGTRMVKVRTTRAWRPRGTST